MSETKIIGNNVPNMPWQERPEDSRPWMPVWRYRENPIIGRNPAEGVARIFNSAVMPYEGAFIGVFRGEQLDGVPYIYLGRSEDAIHWEFDKEKIAFQDETGNDFMPKYAYDPRLVKVEDTYYIIWCQDFFGASIGMAKTTDFKRFVRVENPFLPFNRNAVLFPPENRREIYDAVPSQRQRPYALRRYLHFRERRSGVLGPAPSCHGTRSGVVGVLKDRRRRGAH